MNKKMTLTTLTLKNFKGVKNFILDAGDEDTKAYGDNATGKTTLFDAFIWLLFGKDSNNKSDFQLKTVNGDGEELHGLEHEVEGIFHVDGNEVTLRKMFAEKWTKKRGSATQEFTGHTTDYFVDGVPSKKKEFDDKVKDIIDEDIFKLLTSPSYFNDQLHWKKRREILLEVCGDITDEDVIATNEKLSKLPQMLNDKSIDQLKKIISAKRTEINKELEKIPVRIDEVQRSLPDTSNLNEKKIKKEIEDTKKLIEEKEAEISRMKNGAEVSHKDKKLREIETELIDIKNQHSIDNNKKTGEQRKYLYKLNDDVETIQYDIKKLKRLANDHESTIEEKTNQANQLRADWKKVNASEFSYNGESDCPTCGQVLPEDEIESAKEKALASFNQKKSKELEKINKSGKGAADAAKKAKAESERLSAEISTKETELEETNMQIKSVEKVIKEMESDVTDITENTDYQAKKKQSNEIKKEINELESSVEESIIKVKDEISSLKDTVHNLESDQSKFTQVRQSHQRMEELSEREKELAAEFEKLEEQLYLTEEFIRSKVELLEEKINSKFKFARFKLFKQQVNGGLEEVCETLYKGVPYGAGLNNAARINVGLDIINTLSDHYEFSAPIFVDNAEAVTKLIDMNTQIISLVVSESDKELRVE